MCWGIDRRNFASQCFHYNNVSPLRFEVDVSPPHLDVPWVVNIAANTYQTTTTPSPQRPRLVFRCPYPTTVTLGTSPRKMSTRPISLATTVCRSQLFQGQSRTLLRSHILQMYDDKKREVTSVIAGCDKARWLFATCHSGVTSPWQSMTSAAQCTQRMTVTRVLPRSSYNFPFP